MRTYENTHENLNTKILNLKNIQIHMHMCVYIYCVYIYAYIGKIFY